MKNIIVTCKHKMSLLSRYFRPYLDPYIPEQKSLAQIQAEAWVEVLRIIILENNKMKFYL